MMRTIHGVTLAEQYLFYLEQVNTLRDVGYADVANIIQYEADRMANQLDYSAHQRQH